MRCNRGQSLRIEALDRVRIPRAKPEIAQGAQVIFADTLGGILDKPHPPRAQIKKTFKRVDHPPLRIRVKRVHRKITAQRIVEDTVRKSDNRASPVRFHIPAEGRHLEPLTAADHGDSSMFHARRYGFQPSARGKSHDTLGQCIGRHVDIAIRHAQKRVPHTAPDKIDRMPAVRHRIAYGLGIGIGKPARAGGKGHIIRSVHARNIRAVAPQM